MDIDTIGYYHDLGPADVLISQETFILADFELGKFKPIDIPSQTPWEDTDGDYLAQERVNGSFVEQNVGRAINIWAFGCLMIEVIIYMKRGAASLKEFRKLRLSGRSPGWVDSCFYDKDGSLNSVVLQWVDSLTHGLLHPGPVLILTNLARKALKRDTEDRPKSKIFVRILPKLAWKLIL